MTTLFAEQTKSNKDCTESLCSCFEDPPSNRNYAVGEDGTFTILSLPGRCDTFMMLPCCAFVGCFVSVSAMAKFDDKQQKLTIANWVGYCCIPPCCGLYSVNYGDIANVGLRNTGITEGDDHNKTPLFDTVLVTRDRKIYRIGDRGYEGKLVGELLVLHRFVFGRGEGRDAYTIPSAASLRVPPDDSCCPCWL
jgi:hypothetical protein